MRQARQKAAAVSGLWEGAPLALLLWTRDIVDEILETSRVIGEDKESGTRIQPTADPMMLDELCLRDAAAADFKPDADLED